MMMSRNLECSWESMPSASAHLAHEGFPRRCHRSWDQIKLNKTKQNKPVWDLNSSYWESICSCPPFCHTCDPSRPFDVAKILNSFEGSSGHCRKNTWDLLKHSMSHYHLLLWFSNYGSVWNTVSLLKQSAGLPLSFWFRMHEWGLRISTPPSSQVMEMLQVWGQHSEDHCLRASVWPFGEDC